MQTTGRLSKIGKKSVSERTSTPRRVIENIDLSDENIPEHLMCIETVEKLSNNLELLDEKQQIKAIKAMFTIIHQLEIDPGPIFNFSDYELQVVKILRESTGDVFDAIFSHLPNNFLQKILPNLLVLVCHTNELVRFKFHQRLQTFAPQTILRALAKTKDEFDETGELSLATLIAEKEFELAIPLLEKLAISENSDIRIVVAQCLALESNEKSFELLRKLVKDDDSAVQESAFYALAQNSDAFQLDIFEDGLQHEMTSIREICADAIAQIAPDQFAALLAELFAMHSDEDILFALMLAEKHPDQVIFENIVNLSTHENAEIRTQVARALAGFTTDESYQTLKYLFADPNRDVRLAAFESLLEFAAGNKDFPLHSALEDQDEWIQIAALEAAVALKRIDLATAIFPLLTSGKKVVQSRAIDALIRLRGLDILPEIQNTLVLHGQDADALLGHVMEDKFANI